MKRPDLAALRDFDRLPASANVRLPVVCKIFSISPATVWRWSKSGNLPKPERIGGVTFWNVGELRARLPASSQAADRASQGSIEHPASSPGASPTPPQSNG